MFLYNFKNIKNPKIYGSKFFYKYFISNVYAFLQNLINILLLNYNIDKLIISNLGKSC